MAHVVNSEMLLAQLNRVQASGGRQYAGPGISAENAEKLNAGSLTATARLRGVRRNIVSALLREKYSSVWANPEAAGKGSPCNPRDPLFQWKNSLILPFARLHRRSGLARPVAHPE